MAHAKELLLTATAPAIWGSSYLVTTEFLLNLDPLTISVLRALPAGILLLLIVRQLPTGLWIPKMFVLGALNFSIFWTLLFFAAYRLPGGVAAVVGALQPLVVIFAARGLLGTPIKALSIMATLTGISGVALLILTPEARLDMLGIAAGTLGSVSMAFGIVLSRKWQPPVSALTFTAWQLTAGGLLLVPVTFFFGGHWPNVTMGNVAGLAYLGLIGAALTYVIWLKGIARLQMFEVSVLGFISPLTASLLGWYFLDQTLSWTQAVGMCVVLSSIFLAQYALVPKDVSRTNSP